VADALFKVVIAAMMRKRRIQRRHIKSQGTKERIDLNGRKVNKINAVRGNMGRIFKGAFVFHLWSFMTYGSVA
jgi:hypothetical protein